MSRGAVLVGVVWYIYVGLCCYIDIYTYQNGLVNPILMTMRKDQKKKVRAEVLSLLALLAQKYKY